MTKHATGTRKDFMFGPDYLAGRRRMGWSFPWASSFGDDFKAGLRERPGMSAFVIEDGAVHHTYSTYARGLDTLWGANQWLDRAPKERNQQRAWWNRHDEYGTNERASEGQP